MYALRHVNWWQFQHNFTKSFIFSCVMKEIALQTDATPIRWNEPLQTSTPFARDLVSIPTTDACEVRNQTFL